MEPTERIEKETQTKDEDLTQPLPAPPSVNVGQVVLKEYEATPPGPTRLTGNTLMDIINSTLDALVFGEGGEQQVEEEPARCRMVEAESIDPDATTRDCEGSTDYFACLKGVTFCPAEDVSFPPLPTAEPEGRFAECDPFTREVLGHLSKDEPETYLPYTHFHQHGSTRVTYVLAESPPCVPGWVRDSSSSEA